MIALSVVVGFLLLALLSFAGLLATFAHDHRRSRRGDVGMVRFQQHISALSTEHRREVIGRMKDETKPRGENRYGP